MKTNPNIPPYKLNSISILFNSTYQSHTQHTNHYFQQSLIQEWRDVNDDDSLFLDFYGFKKKIQAYVKNNILDKIKLEEFLNKSIKKSIPVNIFSNRYIYNQTENNINGKGKKLNDIENKFLAEYRNNVIFNNNTIQEYFSLQLCRSPSFLIQNYKHFIKTYGDINTPLQYSRFKAFYNTEIIALFNNLLSDFHNNNYQHSTMIVTIMYDENGNATNKNPFFLLGEANTYPLEQLTLNNINDFKTFNLKNIYISIISVNKYVLLYPSNTTVDIDSLSLQINRYWNVMAFALIEDTMIIQDRFKGYMINEIWAHHYHNTGWLESKTILNKLRETQDLFDS